MNDHLRQLYQIAEKPNRKIIGLMSGTSLDGLDVALCNVEGNGYSTKLKLIQFKTVSYPASLKNEIKTIFAKQTISLEKLCLLNPWIALQHAQIINDCLQEWKLSAKDIDLIASHGQTIYHAPKRLHQQEQFPNATLQIGDGDHLAVATGIITISDFRQKHIAAGGEGAPLAAYGDRLLFGSTDEDRILLNIGGISNLTYLPADTNDAVLCTDLGPGNTMMDAFIQKHFEGMYFDEDGEIAKQGTINETLLTALRSTSFFQQPFPKTTGPELFNLDYLEEAKVNAGIINISASDTMATLNKFSADAIVEGMKLFKNKKAKVFSSGGGMHNKLLMEHLQQTLPEFSFYTTDELNINPDAKEAVLFAVLANECICGNGSNFGKGTTDMPSVTMGKISFPS